MTASWINLVLVVTFCSLVTSQALPARCCSISQWEAYMGTTDTTLSPHFQAIKRGTKHISMDFQNKKMSVVTQYYAGDSSQSKTITDFNNNKEYNIEGNNCSVKSIDFGMQPQCIPSDAVFLGSSYMGGGSSIQLPFNSWNYFLTGFNVNISVSVSQDGCVPLAEVVESASNEYQYTMMAVFTTFTTGIEDPSVFTPPASCQ